MDAFSHFNSKLLATGGNAPEGEGESLIERRPRPAAPTNVKALFDGPGGSSGSGGAWPADESLGFAGPLSFHDPRRVPVHWQAQPPVQTNVSYSIDNFKSLR